MGELGGEPRVAIDLDEQRRQVHSRQPGGGRRCERFDVGGQLLGSEWRHDQRALVVEAGEAFAVGIGEYPFEIGHGCMQRRAAMARRHRWARRT